jgi:glycosyltransferase involved in cell wall biosynthesis
MKILMSALACEPGKGSELEVGYRALLAAASQHEVWLLTNEATVPIVRRALEREGLAERVHFEGIYFEVNDELYPQLTAPGFHRYYDRWQRRAAARAIALDRVVDFDVVHHATLAAYWARTGVAVVDKPLVWGPVGGGVDTPGGLLSELGWRGLLEDAGRRFGRRVLARFGPSRQAARRAVVTFAQNDATLEKIRTAGRTSVLSNATVVDLRALQVGADRPRTKDVLVVGRLLHWKAPLLALRAFRYVETPGAALVFCGDGAERARVERAARQWGLTDRVRLEGWVARDALLPRLATAGALLHPALHEEAGLCVAEALALGTPVVCLAHGGPAELLHQWPDSPSAAIRPSDPETTAREFASAIDSFLADAPRPPDAPRASLTSFDEQLLNAYEVAARTRQCRSIVWGFPRGKPQMFTDSPRALASGVRLYAFGRRLPRFVQLGLSLQVQVPGLRALLAERGELAEPACGWANWQAVLERLQGDTPGVPGDWLHLRSQWGKSRANAIHLDHKGRPDFFLTIEPVSVRAVRPAIEMPSFRAPQRLTSFGVGDWSVCQSELLPSCHRPAMLDVERLRAVARDASRALDGVLERPADAQPHWQPMHGDLVPWNLREDHEGHLWLLDWEDAAWGPPLADVVRYIVAQHSLQGRSSEEIAAAVRTALAGESPAAIGEAAVFWLRHRNFRPLHGQQHWPRQKLRDAVRRASEVGAFRLLASSADRAAARSSERAPVS